MGVNKPWGAVTRCGEASGLLHVTALLLCLLFSACYQSTPARDAWGMDPPVDISPDPGPAPDIPVEPSFDPLPEPGDPPPDPIREDPVADPELPEEVTPDLEPEPDIPAVLMWEDQFPEDSVRWEYQNGEWDVGEGMYCQSSINSFAESWVPAEAWTDFALEASVQFLDSDRSAVKNVMGIMFRVEQISRNEYYLCGLDFKTRILSIVKYDQDVMPGYFTLCEMAPDHPLPEAGSWFTLQAVARGSYLACRWVSGEGLALAEIAVYDSQYREGSIGLFAYNAAGCFDDVLVWSRPPDIWPYPANESASCP